MQTLSSGARRSAGRRARSVCGSGSRKAGSTIQAAATEASKQLGDAGAKAADYVSRKTAEQPLLALLVAGAIGYALASIIHAR